MPSPSVRRFFPWIIILLMATSIGVVASQGLQHGVTVREFLAEVAPEILPSIPEKALALEVLFAPTITTALPSRDLDHPDSADTRGIDDVYVRCSNSFIPGKSVYFGASNTVYYPPFLLMPFMQVWALLLEDGSSIASSIELDTDVWRITTNDTVTVSGGAYYQVISLHYVEFPAAYWPPQSAFTAFCSGTAWIDE